MPDKPQGLFERAAEMLRRRGSPEPTPEPGSEPEHNCATCEARSVCPLPQNPYMDPESASNFALAALEHLFSRSDSSATSRGQFTGETERQVREGIEQSLKSWWDVRERERARQARISSMRALQRLFRI